MSIKELAVKMANENKFVTHKHNTIFSAMEEYGSHAPIVLSAISGMAAQVSANVELYRNSILPDARELADKVKEAAKAAPVDPGAKVRIHPMEHPAILEQLERSGDIDINVVASVSDLPRNPLVIEPGAEPMLPGGLHNDVLDTLKESFLNMGYSDVVKGVRDMADTVFGNVSSSNRRLVAAGVHSHLDHNELTVLLAMTISYIKSDSLRTNMSKNRADVEYLYKLRNVLVTLLKMYSERLKAVESRDVLISRSRVNGVGSGLVCDVYVTAGVYQRYLEDNNIDNIIGAAYERSMAPSNMTRTEVSDPKYKDAYLKRVRMESIKSSLGAVNATRVAFPAVLSKMLSEVSDESLDARGIERDDIGEIIKETTKLVEALSEHELMELVETSRAIMGAVVYQRPDFFDFVSDMKSYHELYPNFTPEELATTATVAYITRAMLEQLTVVKV